MSSFEGRPACADLERVVAPWRRARPLRRRSVKTRDGAVLHDREMFDLDLGVDDAARLLARLGAPDAQVARVRALWPGAESAHVAVEGAGAHRRHKLYLHHPDGLPVDATAAGDGALVFASVAWGTPSAPPSTTTYRIAPPGTAGLAEVLAGLPPDARDVVGELLAGDPSIPVRGSPSLVVTDDATARRSLDLPLLGHRWTVADGLADLAPVARLTGATVAALRAADPDLPERRLARLAVGADHDGRTFATWFHLDPLDA